MSFIETIKATTSEHSSDKKLKQNITKEQRAVNLKLRQEQVKKDKFNEFNEKFITMIKITLPDGSIKEMRDGATSMDVAMSISEGLARNVLAAEVNGEVVDPQRPITGDVELKLVNATRKTGFYTLN